jgi:hypothetical protein
MDDLFTPRIEDLKLGILKFKVGYTLLVSTTRGRNCLIPPFFPTIRALWERKFEYGLTESDLGFRSWRSQSDSARLMWLHKRKARNVQTMMISLEGK